MRTRGHREGSTTHWGQLGGNRCCMAELIVEFSLLLVAENRIRLRHLFELFCRLGIARIAVRMVLFCQLPICLFDRCGIRVFLQTKHFIIISLRHSSHPVVFIVLYDI